MTALAPFGYSRAGTFIVMADGSTVLVHDGNSEGPLWLKDIGKPVIGVAAWDTLIVALDSEGTLFGWNGASPEPDKSFKLGEPCRVLVQSQSAPMLAALGTTTVFVLRWGEPIKTVPGKGVTCLALNSDGTLLALGKEDGTLDVRDLQSMQSSSMRFPSAPSAICWCPRKYWLVATDKSLDAIETTNLGNSEFTMELQGAASWLACNESGEVGAYRFAENKVGVVDFKTLAVGRAELIERTVGQFAFGPEDWLGVALDKGDGNKLGLRSGAVHRTDPHPGRTRNKWSLHWIDLTKAQRLAHPEKTSGLTPLVGVIFLLVLLLLAAIGGLVIWRLIF